MGLKMRKISQIPVLDDLRNFPCFKPDVVARLLATTPSDEELEDARALFAALADRARVKILHAFSSGEELCVYDVAHILQMSVSSASHHLRKLRDLRIIKHRSEGKMIIYSLRDQFSAELIQLVLRKRKK